MLDRAATADTITTQLTELEAALVAVASEESAAKRTLARKNAAIASHDHALRTATSLGSAIFSAANMEELADKLRSAVARRVGEGAEVLEAGEPVAVTDPTPVVAAPHA